MERYCKSNKAETSAVRGRGEVRRSAASGNKWRNWEMLDHEVLALIFTRVPADELARTVPFVCHGWREMMAGPCCWADIDIAEWCRRVDNADVIDATVRKLVRRSRYTVRRLLAYRIGNWGFSLTASFGIHLKVLEIPMSDVNDKFIERYSGTLTALQKLDISFCYNITSEGIRTLGNNCKSLIHLRRNLPSLELLGKATKISEDEAFAVADTMSGLQILELANGLFSDYGLNTILRSCKELSSLDIRGCSKVKLAGDVGKKCDALKFFVDPSYDEYAPYHLCTYPGYDGVDDDDDDDNEEEED